MPCPVAPQEGFLRNMLNRIITSIAWLLADWFGWRAGVAVYPPMLRNKVAIVTGANTGLGLETTKGLLQQGGTVVMACRSLEHGHLAREDILKDTSVHGPVRDADKRLIVLQVDFEEFRTVRKFLDDFHQLGLPGLHVLVNNAGVHLKEHKIVDCGFERTIASNYFGPFYLTQLLLDDLKASAPARVVNVASVSELLGPILYTRTIPWDNLRGQTLPDSGERSYVMSKTLILMATTRELARRLEGTGVDVIAVHPGIADSTWYLKSDDAYTFSWIVSRIRSVAPWVGCGQPVKSGAISSIYASIEPSLTGISSSPTPHGIIDRINRTLFGGRLIYYGPAYLANILGGPINFFNTSRCWVVNPWAYNSAACKRLYDTTLDMITQVEGALGLRSTDSNSTSADMNGTQSDATTNAAPASIAVGGSRTNYTEAVNGALKQRHPAMAAPAGFDDVQLVS